MIVDKTGCDDPPFGVDCPFRRAAQFAELDDFPSLIPTSPRKRFFGIPAPTPTSSQRNTSGRAGWKRLGPVVTIRSRSLGRRVSECWLSAASVMRRLSLNRSEPAKKSGHDIPKNRCRTTIPERMVETLAELPSIWDQVGLFRAQPGRDLAWHRQWAVLHQAITERN